MPPQETDTAPDRTAAPGSGKGSTPVSALPGPVFVYSLREESALLGWLLSWGGAFTVLSPAHFRDRVAATAWAIASRHVRAGEPAGEAPASGDETPVLSASAAPAITVSGASQ